jgi:hypothetical protein
VILGAAGLSHLRLIAAEDLCAEALRRGRWLALARGGLRKSFALSLVERRDLIARRDMAVIDDKPRNLEDLLRHGVGLALHAPTRLGDDGGGLIGFDFAEAARVLGRWVDGAVPGSQGGPQGRAPDSPVRLTPRGCRIAAWQRTGLSTAASGRHWFNTVRALGASARLRLAGAK